MSGIYKKILIVSLLLPAFPVQAVIINEIAWMGTEEQWQDEWIELYNESGEDVSLDGWMLKAEDDSPSIKLEGIIKAESYFLLERTDDTTMPDIEADQIYTGSLDNGGEKLMLLRNNELIEEIDCGLGWFAGDNITKRTMERISPGSSGSKPSSWKASSEKGGTPRTANSEEKEVMQKQMAVANENNSDFPATLFSGIGLSFLISALAGGLFLKFKQKNINIKT